MVFLKIKTLTNKGQMTISDGRKAIAMLEKPVRRENV